MKRPRVPHWIRPRLNIPTVLVLAVLVGLFAQWRDRQLRWIADRQDFAAHYIRGETNMNRSDANIEMRPPWPLGLFGEQGHMGFAVPGPLLLRAHNLFPEAIIEPQVLHPEDQE